MKKSKRVLAAVMSALLLASGLTCFVGAASAVEADTPAVQESYYTIGCFQREGEVAKTSLSLDGQAKIEVAASTLVDIRGYAPEQLGVQLDMRVTRHDGITGPDSLKWVRNGQLTLADSAGTQVFRAGSPVQAGVAAADRVAGEWMTVTFAMGDMQPSSGKLASLSLFDYNDIPKQAEQTGITVEVRRARVVDVTRDADGMERVNYEVGAFYQIEGLYTPNANNQLYADWSTANNAPINVSADRGRYRLTLTLAFASDDASVSAADAWNQITVKLRSADKAGVAGDPNGADNKEHNYGWDFTPASITGSKETVMLSIPLDTDSTNRRGVMDWTDVRQLICYTTLKADTAAHMRVTIADSRIIDMQAVGKLRDQLKAVIDTAQQEDLFSDSDRAAYLAAKEAAQAVYKDDTALPPTMQSALTALKQTFLATADQKAALQTWVDKPVDAALFTASSYEAYAAAIGQAKTTLANAGATRAAVTAVQETVKTAWQELVFDNGPVGLDWGNVDGSEDGVTAADALMALQAATGKVTLTAEQVVLADVDGKDGVTANDALLILQYATKKINAFPVKGEDLSMAVKAVENTDPVTACNPIDISYMFQRAKNDANREDGQATYRESADPAIVMFKDKYYLFASHGNGYWVSTDLADWTFIEVDTPTHEEDPNFTQLNSQFRKYAPATCVIGDTLYLTHSEGGDMLKSTNPDDPNSWELVCKSHGWMDPGMFYDDPATGGDGYVYLYTGLSHRDPIRVIKLDPNNNMAKVDGPYDCCWPDKYNRGFEVSGDTNTSYDSNDTMEGAWPVKYNGKYYLTCAVPGTQYASYSNNCFVSDSPMGPFTYCENSPISWKATGFTQGAGHGALFEDLNGHWWKVDTCRIAGFERRLVLMPANFDEQDDLYTNTVMSDYPFYIPTESADPFNQTGPGWNLLSYDKQATASSNAASASLAFNESMVNSWVAETGNVGEWLQVDLGRVYGVWSVQVNFADKGFTGMGGRDNDYAYRYVMEFSQDGETWYTMVDRTKQTEDLSHEYIEFKNKIGVRYVRITNKGEIPAGGKFAVSGLRVFGEGGGRAPAAVDMSTVIYERREDNNRSIGMSWEAAPGAQGYIVRYGTAPDKLYTHYQVIESQSLVINSLNRGVDYYFTIDSYNESGVTMGTQTFESKATEPLQSGYDVDNNNPAEVNKAANMVVHEAENAHFGGEGVTVEYEVRASGSLALHGMGGTDTYAEFAGVNGGTSGAATLRISYATPWASKAVVKVNGVAAGELTLPQTKGWPTFATVDMPLTGLRKDDDNVIRIEGAGEAFHLDWVQVIYALDSGDHEAGDIIGGLADPTPLADYLLYEAEHAVYGNDGDHPQKVSAANDVGASGGQSLHSMETAGAFVEFRKVDGGNGGKGVLRLGYCCGNAVGEPTLYVNGTSLKDSAYRLPTTGNWTTFKTIQIALDNLRPGTDNVVRIEGGKMGFNPDYIQVIPDDKGDSYGKGSDSDPFEGLANPRQATGYIVYEAEDANFGHTGSGKVTIANDVNASGGKSLHSMENGGYVEFTGVDGGAGGRARLRLSYCEGNAAGDMRLIVNGETIGEYKMLQTGSWSEFKMIEFALDNVLAGSTNIIRLECDSNGYNPDWIQLIYEPA